MPRPLTALPAAAVLATLLSADLAAPASAQLAQRRDLSYPAALAIATGAIEACKALGFSTAAVVVVDRSGDTMVALKDDNARPHAMEAARRKAYTARTFGITTTAFQNELPTRPSRRDQTLLPHVTGLNGGVPVKLGNEVIAGVGVAGSPGKDEECANAGLEKVKAALQ
jgi:uncharacterized protein GlcG (DUF336 family)